MDVTSTNFSDALALFQESIKDCDFCAVDVEFSGISIPGVDLSGCDIPEVRYYKLRKIVQSLAIFQIGFCVFRRSDPKSEILEPRSFNIWTYPRDTHIKGGNKCFTKKTSFRMDSSAIHFLRETGFDFSTCCSKGVNYCNASEESALSSFLDSSDWTGTAAEKRAIKHTVVGARLFWSALVSSGVPLALHNAAFDFLVLMHYLESPLPSTFSEFVVLKTRRCPSPLVDTKVLAAVVDNIPVETSLESLYTILMESLMNNNNTSSSNATCTVTTAATTAVGSNVVTSGAKNSVNSLPLPSCSTTSAKAAANSSGKTKFNIAAPTFVPSNSSTESSQSDSLLSLKTPDAPFSKYHLGAACGRSWVASPLLSPPSLLASPANVRTESSHLLQMATLGGLKSGSFNSASSSGAPTCYHEAGFDALQTGRVLLALRLKCKPENWSTIVSRMCNNIYLKKSQWTLAVGGALFSLSQLLKKETRPPPSALVNSLGVRPAYPVASLPTLVEHSREHSTIARTIGVLADAYTITYPATLALSSASCGSNASIGTNCAGSGNNNDQIMALVAPCPVSSPPWPNPPIVYIIDCVNPNIRTSNLLEMLENPMPTLPSLPAVGHAPAYLKANIHANHSPMSPVELTSPAVNSTPCAPGGTNGAIQVRWGSDFRRAVISTTVVSDLGLLLAQSAHSPMLGSKNSIKSPAANLGGPPWFAVRTIDEFLKVERSSLSNLVDGDNSVTYSLPSTVRVSPVSSNVSNLGSGSQTANATGSNPAPVMATVVRATVVGSQPPPAPVTLGPGWWGANARERENVMISSPANGSAVHSNNTTGSNSSVNVSSNNNSNSNNNNVNNVLNGNTNSTQNANGGSSAVASTPPHILGSGRATPIKPIPVIMGSRHQQSFNNSSNANNGSSNNNNNQIINNHFINEGGSYGGAAWNGWQPSRGAAGLGRNNQSGGNSTATTGSGNGTHRGSKW